MKAKIQVTLRNGVLDPQGKAVEHSLASLGFKGVSGVRVGKYIEVDVQAETQAQAEAEVQKMCEQLLANTVIEKYAITIDPS